MHALASRWPTWVAEGAESVSGAPQGSSHPKAALPGSIGGILHGLLMRNDMHMHTTHAHARDACTCKYPRASSSCVPVCAKLAPPAEWPYDVDDLMLDACRTTRFNFGVGRYNHWNNYHGTILAVEHARASGCRVTLVEGEVAHCGYFFRRTCSHNC